MQIRAATPDDAEAIVAIYAHHVLHGTASFDEVPPSVEFWREKIGAILAKGWPFLVVTEDGQVIGYCYATQFRDRPAYAFTCENSIYVQADKVGRGIGKTLLNELCRRCEALGFRHMIAVVGGAEPASIALHESCGFEIVGRLSSVGWKMGRWLDTVYMQRALGKGAETSPSNI